MMDPPYMTRGAIVLASGERVPLKYKARGSFSKIYFRADGVPEVFAVVESGTDYSKEIVASIWDDGGGTRYLPQVLREGSLPDDSLVYRMPVYKTPLRKTDNPKAWRDFVTLKRCAENANRQFMGHRQRDYAGYEINGVIIECAARDPKFSPELLATLENLRDTAMNYGSSYQFEFATRNMATDSSGHLILLDVLFDLEAMSRKLRERRSKAVSPW